MIRLLCAIVLILTAVPGLLAQDWRDVDNNGIAYNCELVDVLTEEYGDENIMRRDSGEVTSLAELLDDLFFDCLDNPPTEEEMEVIVVLYDKVSHEWGEPECSILMEDWYDENFTFLIGGYRLNGLVLDVYLPGESDPVEMDYVDTDVLESGTPVRREVLIGDTFPLGNYFFHVHIDDRTYKFSWRRSDDSMDALSLSCLGREEVDEDDSGTSEAMTEAPALDDDIEVTAVLSTATMYSIDEKDCSVQVDDRFEGDFNLAVNGHGQNRMSVDIYLPGEDEALKMDHSHSYNVDIGTIVPSRTEWAVRPSFPMGWYTFEVHIDDSAYRFQWLRERERHNTVTLTCLFPPPDSEDGLVFHLTDGASMELGDTACSAFAIDWEANFQVIAGGHRHDEILIDVTFPGEDEPVEFENSEVMELDNGTPFRLDWLEGDDFPLGAYTLDVTIGEGDYQIVWDRQDPVYNTVGISCQGDG